MKRTAQQYNVDNIKEAIINTNFPERALFVNYGATSRLAAYNNFKCLTM